jgi:hypothetical protein
MPLSGRTTSGPRRPLFLLAIVFLITLVLSIGQVPAGSADPGPQPAGPATTPGSTAGATTAQHTADRARQRAAARKPTAKLHLSRRDLTLDKATLRISTRGSKAPAGLRKLTVRFGDGTRPLTRRHLRVRAAHTYLKGGRFTVRVTVTDKRGRTARTRAVVYVAAARSIRPMGGRAPAREVTAQSPLVGAVGLPVSVNLSNYSVPVGNQGQVSSCVSWAIGYAMMGWYYNKLGRSGPPFAPMFVYSLTNNGADRGSWPADALKVLGERGIDTKAHYGAGWATDWRTRPNTEQAANAYKYRLTGARPLFSHTNSGATPTDVYNIQAELAAQHPVAIDIRVRSSFQTLKSGTWSGTGPYVAPAGYHEILAVGYNATGLLIQNSWGSTWGSNGYAWIPWQNVKADVVAADTASGVVTATTTTDTTAPTITTAPVQRLNAGDTLLSSGIPVSLSWAGADNSGTVASYDLWANTNGQGWTRQTLNPSNATSIKYALARGSTYQFAVRATDASGNTSAWSYGSSFTVGDYSEVSSPVSYSTGWLRTAWASANGGYLTYSGTPNAWVTFKFAARNVAWVGTTGSNRGQSYVFLDGTYQLTKDMYSAATRAQVLGVVANGLTGTHTLELDVVGTAGRPTVDVDSFVILY